MTSGRTYIALCGTAAILALAACSTDTPMPTDLQPDFSKQGGSTSTDPSATWRLPLADAGLALRSDGKYGDGTFSVYAAGVCGVVGTIFATQQKSNTGDAIIRTDVVAAKGKTPGCSRSFTLHYPDGITETVRSFNNLRNLQNTTNRIPVGESARRLLILNPGVMEASSRCGRLLFGRGDLNPDNGVGSHEVLVTRLNARTWHVQSDGANNLAWCQNTGELFAMPIDFQVEASHDLPL